MAAQAAGVILLMYGQVLLLIQGITMLFICFAAPLLQAAAEGYVASRVPFRCALPYSQAAACFLDSFCSVYCAILRFSAYGSRTLMLLLTIGVYHFMHLPTLCPTALRCRF